MLPNTIAFPLASAFCASETPFAQGLRVAKGPDKRAPPILTTRAEPPPCPRRARSGRWGRWSRWEPAPGPRGGCEPEEVGRRRAAEKGERDDFQA